MDEHVYITRIEFRDIGGMSEMVLEPKPFTVIRGRNGAGKTSIVKAFRRFFEGGYDPTIVRKGADKGTIKITFSDGCYGLRTINAKTRKSNLELFSANGEVIRPPQESIEQYAAGFAFDPLRILSAKKTDRLDYLEQFLNVKVQPSEIFEACQERDFLRLLDPKESAFANIDRVAASAYQQRTAINQDVGNLRGAVETIRRDVPSLNDDGVDWSKAEEGARSELIAAESAHKAALAQITEEAKGARDAAELAFANSSKEIEAEYLAAMRAAEQQRERRMAEARTVKAETIKVVGDSLAAAKEDVQQAQGKAAEEARSRYDAAKKALDSYNEANGARASILKLEAQIKEKAGRSTFLTNVLDRLKELRLEKQKSNPIPGLEVRDGDIYYGEVEFDALNTGKRMELCIKLAVLGVGKCPVLIIDDAVNIDEENWKAFEAAARESELQIVAARLDDGELRIETEGVAA